MGWSTFRPFQALQETGWSTYGPFHALREQSTYGPFQAPRKTGQSIYGPFQAPQKTGWSTYGPFQAPWKTGWGTHFSLPPLPPPPFLCHMQNCSLCISLWFLSQCVSVWWCNPQPKQTEISTIGTLSFLCLRKMMVLDKMCAYVN